MAAITDLKWAEINAESPSDIASFNTDDIVISLKNLTGDTYSSLDDEGVCEALYKLSDLIRKAQSTKNTANSPVAGEALNVISPFTFVGPDENGTVFVTATTRFTAQLNANNAKGQNI
jgi:hypothetical protein